MDIVLYGPGGLQQSNLQRLTASPRVKYPNCTTSNDCRYFLLLLSPFPVLLFSISAYTLSRIHAAQSNASAARFSRRWLVPFCPLVHRCSSSFIRIFVFSLYVRLALSFAEW